MLHSRQKQGVDFFDKPGSDCPLSGYHIFKEVDGLRVIAGIEKILQWLAFNGDAVLQEIECVAARESASLNRV